MNVIISLVILSAYTLWVCIKYGIPSSLSQSYYEIKWGPIFTLVLWTSALLVLPTCMDITPYTQIIPFAGIFGLMLVGAAPRVRDYEKTVHIIGASIAGIFSQLWVIFYRNPWWMMLWVIPMITFIIIFIKTINKGNLSMELDKVRFIFWCEIICFANLYINLLLS